MFKRLIEYLDSIEARDPAPRSRWEVLLYPGLWAVGFYRVCVIDGILPHSPADYVRRPTVPACGPMT